MSHLRVPVRPVTLVTSKNTLERLKTGVNILADAVGSTLGAGGRTVIIEDGGGNPHPTKDGVTVAENIFLKDPVENMGALMVRQSAMKTAEEAGDGTTSSTIITQTIINNFKPDKSLRFTMFREGMNEAVRQAFEIVDREKRRLNKPQIESVATISANNDRELGKLISNAFKKAGKYGMVLMDRSYDGVTRVETVEGMQVDQGYSSSYFVNNEEKGRVEFTNPFVFVSTLKIEHLPQISPILAAAIHTQRPLLIFAEMSTEARNALIQNVMNGTLKACVVSPPSLGYRRKDMMEDIAIMAGTKVFSKELGDNFELLAHRGDDASKSKVMAKVKTILGEGIHKATISQNKTILTVDPDKDNSRLDEHRKVLEKQLKDKDASKQEKAWTKERIAGIAGSVAVVMVGAKTEAESKEKCDRVDDAIHAVEAALEHGVVAGGGIPLYRASQELQCPAGMSHSFNTGFSLVKGAMAAPFFKQLENAGLEVRAVRLMLDEVKEEDAYTTGIDIETFEVVDMVKKGIIDPAKVVKCALENAVSASFNLISTSNVITFTGVEKETIVGKKEELKDEPS